MVTQPEKQSFLSTLTFGNWLAIALVILAIAFIAQNRERISVDVFFVSMSLPLWISLGIVFFAGWLSGLLWKRRRSKSAR